MKKLLLFLLLFFCLQPATEAAVVDSIAQNKVKEIISAVQKKYAPDKRTAFFQTEVQAGTSLVIYIETTELNAITELKALLKQAQLPVTLHEKNLPDQELGEAVYGIANLSVCNNRVMPGHPAEMATQTLLGTPVQILKAEKRYYLVRTPDNYISWTEAAGITQMNRTDFQKWQAADKLVFNEQSGQAYAEPAKKALPVSDLVKGNILQVSGKKKKYYKVSFPDNRTGYILVKQTVPYAKWVSQPNPDAEQILNTGKTLIGVPYLWGGTSTKGVDCSGFTKTCFFLNGIIIPRDASQQALAGEKVDIYEHDTISIAKCLQTLQPGDLLFFAAGKNRSANPRVTHTAIYMGNGEFIQSSGSVRINSLVAGVPLYDEHEAKTLVSARRMLNAIGSSEISRLDQHPLYKLIETKYNR